MILPLRIAISRIFAKSFSFFISSVTIISSMRKSWLASASLKFWFSKTKPFPSFSSVVVSLQKSGLRTSLSPFVFGFPDFGAFAFIFNSVSPSDVLKLSAKNDLGNSFRRLRISFPDISMSIAYLFTP